MSSCLNPIRYRFRSVSLKVQFPNYFSTLTIDFLQYYLFFSCSRCHLKKVSAAVNEKVEYSGSCSLSNRASQGHTCIGTLQLPELPRFTAYETSCNVISLGGWYSCHGFPALQFTQHLVYGATGSRNGHLWTSACLAWGTNKEVWYEVTLSFEIFDFRKIFNLLCIFATELCMSPTSGTPSRHLNLIQIPLHLAAFRLFFDLYGFWPWLFSLPPLALSLGTGCLSAVSEEKTPRPLLHSHPQLLHCCKTFEPSENYFLVSFFTA